MILENTLTPCIKINTTWLKNLNIRQDTIKLLGENIGKTFSEINHTNLFLCQSPRAIGIKTKINQWNLVKLKSLCTAKETIKKNPQLTEWEKIAANNAINKALISEIY